MQSMWCCDFFFSFFMKWCLSYFPLVFFICCLKRKVKFLHFLESQINIRTKHTVHFAMCEINSHRASSWSTEDDLGNPFHKIRDKRLWRTEADSQSPFLFWSNLKWGAASFPPLKSRRASQVFTKSGATRNIFINTIPAHLWPGIRRLLSRWLKANYNWSTLTERIIDCEYADECAQTPPQNPGTPQHTIHTLI